MKEENKIKYFAYLRKSTEGDERQILSIDSQKDKIYEYFNDLDIVEILEEKHSAFKPYNRPVFAEMISRIQTGEAKGIIAWHPDRLSRNEIDASTITYFIRTGIISDLKFASYNFDNSPEGIMMLQLALSQSQYFSSKLGKDVKRGLEKRFKIGWAPNKVPEGYRTYLQENGFKIVIPDQERFDFIKKSFDLLLTGEHTISEVLNTLNNEWGFTTRKKGRKLGGKPMSRSAFYRIFSDPFYIGMIKLKDEERKGKHKPMLSPDEFNQVQKILGKYGKPRRRKYEFPYRGLIRCKNCNGLITADYKHQIIKSQQTMKTFVYYHCARRPGELACGQKPITQTEAERQIIKEIAKHQLNPKFLELALEIINNLSHEEEKNNEIIRERIKKTKKNLKDDIKSLTQMRCKNLLSDEEYLESKNDLVAQLSKLPETDKDVSINDEEVNDLTIKTFEFAFNGLNRFVNGSLDDKRVIFSNLFSECYMKDKKLLILVNKWFEPIKNYRYLLNDKIKCFEMRKTPINKGDEALIHTLSPALAVKRDSD